MSDITVITSARTMRMWSEATRKRAETIALVPTMGSLHEGHLALIRHARKTADRVVLSIFVNPTQFAPHEDFDAYPRNLERDLELLRGLGVDVVFTPTRQEVYSPHHDCYVLPKNLAMALCGQSRPTFFQGVCTVVLILFRITLCHRAVFGEKDYQQLQIIRQMVLDLWLDVEIVAHPLVREADGLAMSSRNAYLSPEDRATALSLQKALNSVQTLFQTGQYATNKLLQAGRQCITETGHVRIDYFAIVDAATLRKIDIIKSDALCAGAIYVRNVRLIDNQLLLSPKTPKSKM